MKVKNLTADCFRKKCRDAGFTELSSPIPDGHGFATNSGDLGLSLDEYLDYVLKEMIAILESTNEPLQFYKIYVYEKDDVFYLELNCTGADANLERFEPVL